MSYLSFARAASRLFNSDSVSARPPLRWWFTARVVILACPGLRVSAGRNCAQLRRKFTSPKSWSPIRYVCSPFPSVSVFRRASSLGELRCCLVRERCIALPGRGLTFCHGNVAWVNRLERPETVRLPLAFRCLLADALGSKPSLFPGPAAAHRLCVRTRGPHHLSPHPRDGGDPRFSPDA